MKQEFYKYQGTGNDFVLIDNRSNNLNHRDATWLARLCDRRFGVGSDGIIFLQEKQGYDFEMIYYNSDGKTSSMCGNGARCSVAFGKSLGLITNEAYFLAADGAHHAKVLDNSDWVSLQMIDVTTMQVEEGAYVLNTGTLHCVRLIDNIENQDVYLMGKSIRNSDKYREQGINVNFVEHLESGFYVRTYERGVENETFSCGTGAVAVALAMAKHYGQSGSIVTPITTRGGTLHVQFLYENKVFSNIFLEGPVKQVFRGQIEL